jgi:uncharacterized membrane protein YcfT
MPVLLLAKFLAAGTGMSDQTMNATAARIDWVDVSKGICIIMVVMMHSTLGVELAAGAQGWMHNVLAFARPFRMPDFFLISGLFLGLVIDRPWRRFIDRKVVHFAYFYVLWLTIQFVFKAPGIAVEEGMGAAIEDYLMAFIQPFGTLWFIYILPIFFVVTRLLKAVPVWIVFAWAALLEIAPVATGSVIFDEFCARYVYFFVGYAFAARIFSIAEWLRAHPALALLLLAIWAPVNALLVFIPAPEALAPYLQADLGYTGATGGWSELPFVSLVLGLAGCLVVVGIGVLVSRLKAMQWLRWLGAHSIVVYLAFFLPMAVTRTVLLKLGIIADIGTISLLVTAAGVIGPVVLYALVQWSGRGKFLFERPDWAYIDRPARREADAPIAAG